jgi:hypothetical protein
MRSPKDMRTIQIDITNACVHKCSNCTRFCGHHKKPFFMEWETFKKAVDSLSGFKKRIGIMGGEPTLHPQFERFVRYLGEKHPSKVKLPAATKPIKNFIKYIRDRNFYLDETLNQRKGPGLWTSLCNNYYEYYELIQDVFSYQCINDHQNLSRHQPLLVSRKELGIPDDEWIELRDKCWIQNTWSAAITPKGAFFCEVAGALDMLFDGPGGWRIEPGWWKREPDEFGDQLEWCEICSGALMNYGRLSNEEIDDVSPMMYKKLEEIGSPKLKAGMVNIIDLNNPQIKGVEMPNTRNRYLTDYEKRVSCGNRSVYMRSLNAILFIDNINKLDSLTERVRQASEVFDSVKLTAVDHKMLGELKRKNFSNNVQLITPEHGEWGRTLNKMIAEYTVKDWVYLSAGKENIPINIVGKMRNIVINPGVLYEFEGVYFFNKRSQALKNAGFDGIGACRDINDFIKLWNPEKKEILTENSFNDCNSDLEDWFRFADSLNIDDKTSIYRCLEKISKDQQLLI